MLETCWKNLQINLRLHKFTEFQGRLLISRKVVNFTVDVTCVKSRNSLERFIE